MRDLDLPATDLVRQEPSLVLVGTDFRRASLELRERVAYSPDQATDALVHLLARSEVAEACLLSTCNRTEVYVRPRHTEEAAFRAALERVFLERYGEIEAQGKLYVKWHTEAAEHLMAVACGLESMVLGEPEILGQVRQAAHLAEAVGASGTVLRQLLRAALTAGKRARSETAISTGAVSFGYAVVELARNIFSHLEDCRVLLLGAGEISYQVARNLKERGVQHLTIANRTRERAEGFREEFPEAHVADFEQRQEALAGADLVVTSTAAEEPILSTAQVASAMARRRSRPLLVVDLGVPRNVEGKAGRLENVFLHDIDALETLVGHNLRRRREEVPRVEEIIERELGLFYGWFRSLEAKPLVDRLQRRAEEIRQREVQRVLEQFPAGTHPALEQLTRSLVRKILHHPSTRLRRSEGDNLPHLALVRELFQLDEEDHEG